MAAVTDNLLREVELLLVCSEEGTRDALQLDARDVVRRTNRFSRVYLITADHRAIN